MFESSSLKPKSHPYIETEKEAHLRAVLQVFLTPAFNQLAEDLERDGTSLTVTSVSIIPTLRVAADLTLINGSIFKVHVQWAFENYFVVTVNGTAHLSWARSMRGVRYSAGNQAHLTHAVNDALRTSLNMLNDPSWHLYGVPDRLLE